MRKLKRQQRLESLKQAAREMAKATGRNGEKRRRRRRGRRGGGGGGVIGGGSALGAGGFGSDGAGGGDADPLDDDPRVDQLAMMGFSRKACKLALRNRSNVDAALDFLFANPGGHGNWTKVVLSLIALVHCSSRCDGVTRRRAQPGDGEPFIECDSQERYPRNTPVSTPLMCIDSTDISPSLVCLFASKEGVARRRARPRGSRACCSAGCLGG